MKLPICIDFETEAIQARPHYPPKPVGVAIKWPGKPARYYAFGHPTKNNCNRGDAEEALAACYFSDGELLFHNGKFDLDVAQTHFNLAVPDWQRIHDTMFLLFLSEPHAESLSLKPSAERLLGLPPGERDAVRDWLVEHGVIGATENPGAFIARAPGDLVGRYAIGDVDRTLGLYKLLLPRVKKEAMFDAYCRERQLLPILLKNEADGIRADVKALERDLGLYGKAHADVAAWLRKQLKAPGLNLEADADVAKALSKAKIVEEFPKTPTGRDSVSKKNLTKKFFAEPDVWLGMYYYNALSTVLSMSIKPWLEQAQASGGKIFTEWNQVRTSHGNDGFKGARSGRITCSRFQNITKSFLDRGDEYGIEGDARIRGLLKLPELPLVRKYLLPDVGDRWVHRDYNQQELRLVAHYEDGALAEQYRRDPKTDVHTFVKSLMDAATGKDFSRRAVKVVNFQTVYGGGAPALMRSLGIDPQAAAELRAAWKRALPDVVTLDRDLKTLFYEGEHIRTIGGRVYHCKPPTIAKSGPRKGQVVTYEYTALNYLIQPSGADVTKEAIIRYHAHPKRDSRMLVTVHDEINISAPKSKWKEQDAILRECMESIELLVPWRTEGKSGSSWGEIK